MSVDSKRNILTIRFLMLAFVGLFIVNASIANAAPEPRTRTSKASEKAEKKQKKEAEKAAAKAKIIKENADNIDANLTDLLSNINVQMYPDQDAIAETADILDTTKRSLKSFEEDAQCQYFMLQAWNNYFSGDKDMALKVSTKAYKTDPKNNDARLTHTAMAILNGERPITIDPDKVSKKKKPKNNRQRSQRGHNGQMGGMRPMMGPGGGMMGPNMGTGSLSTNTSSGEILRFDADTISKRMLGESAEAMEVDCLNSTIFSYDPQDSTLCAMVWSMGLKDKSVGTGKKGTADPNDNKKKKADPRRPAPPMNPGMMMGPMGGMGGVGLAGYKQAALGDGGDPLSRGMNAYSVIFGNNYDNHAIKFVAVNIDSAESTGHEVLMQTMQNSWPWAQVIGKEQAENAGLGFEIPEMPAGIKTAMLIIADTEGSVRYAGSAEGFMAPLLLHDLAPKSAASTAKRPPRRKVALKEAAREIQTAVKAALKEEAREEEEFNPQAEKLLENAKGFIKIGRFTSYKKGINMCRQVINDYPGTKYEQQARDVLRGVPERHHKRYGITDADLGK